MNKTKISILIGISLLLGIFLYNFTKKESSYKEDDTKETPSQIVGENTLSMMLETAYQSGNYNMTTQSSWPTKGYSFNATLSKCENGGELSWDDEKKVVSMSGNMSDKCYVYFDKQTLADWVIEQYNNTQGNNNIYYHDGTITSGATIIDANDGSYRYAGANPNNYVCFGSDATPCPADNLYRIIGVFGENNHGVTDKQLVKLIKHDYATSTQLGTDGAYSGAYTLGSSTYKGSNYSNVASYHWNNDTNYNTWSQSNLNTNYISYLDGINTKWANMIAKVTWKVGGNTYGNIAFVVPATAYTNEITNPVTTNTTDNATEYGPSNESKIGLMYLSDYEFAADKSAWTTYLSSYNSSSVTSVNWMYMGLYEWPISRNSDDSSAAFFVSSNGGTALTN